MAAAAEAERKSDDISLEFRQIIKDHLKLIQGEEPEDMNDPAVYEKKEASNHQNLSIIAYALAFLIYSFEDVEPFVFKSNVNWAAQQLIEAVTITDRGRKLDKTMYYQLREKMRDYLKAVNTDLTRIDDQPIDVWRHCFRRFDATLNKLGLPEDLRG
jgi:hypothetical protein